jgi:hypothetical protein
MSVASQILASMDSLPTIVIDLTSEDPAIPRGRESVTCGQCKSWAGRCLKDRLGRIASSEACEGFEPRT